MKKSVSIFAAGVLAGCLATGGYFYKKEWECLEIAMLADPNVTAVEAQRVFAGCYQPGLRFVGRNEWEREMWEKKMMLKKREANREND